MSTAQPMDPEQRSLAYRVSMLQTHAGRRRYTSRQIRRMRQKERKAFDGRARH